jgi:hypothetical protein
VFFVYTTLLFVLALSSIVLLNVYDSKPAYFLILKLYVILEYAMFCLFFYCLLKNDFFKKVVLFSIIPFSAFAIYTFINSPKGSFSTTPLLLEFLLLIIILLFYFFEKVRHITNNPMQNSISFWLCVGLLLYFFGNFFYVTTLNTSKDIAFIKQVKTICSIIIIAKDIVLALAWLGKEPIETDDDIIRIPDSLDFDKDFEELRQNKNNKIS